MTTTVLIADRETANRIALRHHLQAAPDIDVLGEAGDGDHTISEALRLRPHVVLLDLSLTGMDGLTALRHLAHQPADRAPNIIALAAAAADTDEHLFAALRAGAAGYLHKNCEPALYVQAARCARHGDGFIDPGVTRRLIRRLTMLSPCPPPTDLAGLTPRELQVLRHLAQGLTNRYIARTLAIQEGTVKTHVNRILSKLDLDSRLQATIYAYRHGIATPPNAPPLIAAG